MSVPPPPSNEPAPVGGSASPPHVVSPMMAVLGKLPRSSEQWAFEYKWDGIRAIGYHDAAGWRMTNRNGVEITGRYPELAGLAEGLAGREVVLDGEVVALDERGRPRFSLMQRRMHITSAAEAARRVRRTPVVLMIFDLLHLDGQSLLDEPYERRRELLEGLELRGGHWQTPPSHTGEGRALLEAARGVGLEGVLAKRLGSPYRPGARSEHWRKIKVLRQQEMVVGGYIPIRKEREGPPGALLLGYFESGKLRYAGKVGTGFSNEDRTRLARLLQPRRREASPFQAGPKPPPAIYVEPELVVDIRFGHWTDAGQMRHPSFQGLRDDKAPRNVVRES